MDGGVRVVVGLGNPGARYEGTRHNIGFRLLDRLARDLDAGPEEDAGACRVRPVRWGEERVYLVKPMDFMNRSGEALARLPESEAAGPQGHLVVLDDAWLPFGAIRFRREGGDGGHKGLRSVLQHLGTERVPRLRLGIGGAEVEDDLVEHVLDRFSEEEERGIAPWLERASLGVRVFLEEGADAAMSRFNG